MQFKHEVSRSVRYPYALARLEAKIDAYASQSASRTPWFRSPAALVSIAAFIISVVTTITSAYRTYRQDIELQKAGLQSTLLQLSTLAIQNVEWSLKYKDEPALRGMQSVLNAQNSVLTRKAHSLVIELGSSVSAVDIGIVANALLAVGEVSAADKLLVSGLDRAANISDYTFVARTLGMIRISAGDIDEGNRYWTLAMKASEKFADDAKSGYVNFTNAITQLMWAEVLATRDCSGAWKHVSDADEYIPKAGDPTPVLAHRNELKARLARVCPAGDPSGKPVNSKN